MCLVPCRIMNLEVYRRELPRAMLCHWEVICFDKRLSSLHIIASFECGKRTAKKGYAENAVWKEWVRECELN